MKVALTTLLFYDQFYSHSIVFYYLSDTSLDYKFLPNFEFNTLLNSFSSLQVDNWGIHILKFLVIPLLFFLTLIVSFLLIRNQYMSIVLEKRKKNIEDTANTLLMELIFLKECRGQMEKKIEEIKNQIPFNKKWCQNYMLKKVMDMNKTFQVDNKIHLEIFKLFGFDKISYQLLRHKKWHFKSIAVYRLQRMQDQSKRSQISHFLKDSHPELKSNALTALVALSPEKFTALSDFNESLTKVDEMKILDVLHENDPKMPNGSEKLLQSKNTSIVILGIKLMVLYRAKFSLNQMEQLIRFSDLKVRRAAIKAAGKLKMIEANEILINQYHVEGSKELKIIILRSLKSIGNKKAELFLKSLLEKEEDQEVKFEIVTSLNAVNPSFFENSVNPKILMNKMIQGMALHVKDPYLI